TIPLLQFYVHIFESGVRCYDYDNVERLRKPSNRQ
ncbi:hypothetical protein Y032_0930g3085, partial [Ancylostoma ceylanicum]